MLISQQISLILYWLTVAAFVTSFIFYAAKVKMPSKSYLKWATVFIVSGLILETLTIVTRLIAIGGFANTSLFEVVMFVSWFIVLEALIIEVWTKVRILGFYASLLAVVMLVAGFSRYSVPKALFENLQSTTIVLHLTLIFIAYGAFIIAAGSAAFYLMQERQLKRKQPGPIQKFLPSLQVLDEASFRSVISGFIVYTIALVIGVGMAMNMWQGHWQTSITIASFTTWFVYLFYLVSRFTIGWVGKNSSYLAIAGIIPLIATGIISYLSMRY